MRILIVGGGGREHALAWRLAKSPSVNAIFASPGNPGIAKIGTCLPAPAAISDFVDLAEAHQIDLTVVGPEAPLVFGIVDRFRARKLAIIGPTQAAARLEGSKLFAKKFFARAGIPTARSGTSIDEFPFPVVIKADGLAAGKGVTIARDRVEAEEAIAHLGPNPVIEEFLEGEEISFIGLSNGTSIMPLAPTQDHKRIFDNDEGPNTGGMGAYRDPHILSAIEISNIMDRIMLPAIAQMRREGNPFTGFLYAGLMMTQDGPKVLEFNVRLGDPETQALMCGFQGDLAELFEASVEHDREIAAHSWTGSSVCVVISAQGYPGKPRTGDRITGIEDAEACGAIVFHAGTTQTDNALTTNGGRVLGITAAGETLRCAVDNTYAAVAKIHFDGMHYRKDIGQRGLRRGASN